MPSTALHDSDSDGAGGRSAIPCDACQSAIRSDGQRTVSFLLLDRFTIPVLGCDDHLDQFASVCGLTSKDPVELLHHRPAGGISCPGCRHARYAAGHPMIPVHGGAVLVPACPEHQSAITQRFHTGRRTRHRLTASLDAPNVSP